MSAELKWTGECTPRNMGLLNLAYRDRADVLLEGRWVGSVFHLYDGWYHPSIDGIADDKCATPDEAMRSVVDMHQKFRVRVKRDG